MSDAGKVSISEAARMYGKSRKWVYDQIKKHGIIAEKSIDGNVRCFQLVDLIAHRGEPKNNGSAPTGTGNSVEVRTITPESTVSTVVFSEKIKLLEQQAEALHQDKEELKQRLREEREEHQQREGRLFQMLEKEQEKTKTLMLEYHRENDQKTEEQEQKSSDRWLVWGLGVFTLIVGVTAMVAVYYLLQSGT